MVQGYGTVGRQGKIEGDNETQEKGGTGGGAQTRKALDPIHTQRAKIF
jgi:hypothetical protein